MKVQETNTSKGKPLNSSFGILVLFCSILYGLAIFQDYVFSKIRFTGFYWTDTMLYNIYWLLFIALLPVANGIYDKVRPGSLVNKILYVSSTGLLFSVVHIFLFTSIFILGSILIFPEPHGFSTIFKNAFSNQLQITVIAYLCSPFIVEYIKRKKQKTDYFTTQKTVTIKNGTRRSKIETSSILCIKTDRPYTTVYSNDQKLLHDESLKKLEELLDTQIFLRVHRSVIINKNHVAELISRKNGDYDGKLTNGQFIRFSRHYRKNWNELLNH